MPEKDNYYSSLLEMQAVSTKRMSGIKEQV
jgi:hypothetical protein